MYCIYRSSFAFSLTSRADGELIDNSQALLMMKLSLILVWISAIQHFILSSPWIQDYIKKEEMVPDSISNQNNLKKDDIHIVQTKAESLLVEMKKDKSLMNSVIHAISSLFNNQSSVKVSDDTENLV